MQQLLRWQAIADLLVLTAGIYLALSWARRARALRIVLLLLALHGASLIANHFELLITGWLLEAAAVIALVVLVLGFQAEVRYAVLRMDRMLRIRPGPAPASGESWTVVAESAFAFAARRLGSLMVIVRKDPIKELVHDGVGLAADVSPQLLEAIFQKCSPLHDGAAVLEGARVARAAAYLPLTQRSDVPLYFGTRHRAAIGLAERCDALVVVTSEERGEVTLMEGRNFRRMANPLQLEHALVLEGRAARGIGSTLRRVFLSDLKWKAAALGIAAAIWSTSFVLAGTTVRSVSVPVEFSNVPAGMEVTSQSADHVEVQLRGSSWIMDSLATGRLVAHVDLGGVAEGTRVIRVTAGDFDLPPGVVVDRVVPPSLRLSLFAPAGGHVAPSRSTGH